MLEEYEVPITEGFYYNEQLKLYLVYADGQLRGAAKTQAEAAAMYERVRGWE